jgi:amino acid transporter
MTIVAPSAPDSKSQLRKTMGFWDVLLFNIATVLGPRWIAAAGHNGTSSISLWVLAAVFFFVPAHWSSTSFLRAFLRKAAFTCGRARPSALSWFHRRLDLLDLHLLLFPGLLLASASMSAYIIGGRGALLAQDRTFQLTVSLAMLLVAVLLNIIGLNIGKWLQNAGGVGTYVPLLMLVAVAALVVLRHGSATHFTVANMMPAWNWDTVNFWSQIAFAFTGLELVSAMSEEMRDPRRTLPRGLLEPARSSPSCTSPEPLPFSRWCPPPISTRRAASSTPLPLARSCSRSASSACSRPSSLRWAMQAASAAR